MKDEQELQESMKDEGELQESRKDEGKLQENMKGEEELQEEVLQKEAEFLKKVEKAAQKGAKAGSRKSGFLSMIITIAVILLALYGAKYYISQKWTNFTAELKEQFSREESADAHDMVLENDGIFGYTAADFAEAILGDEKGLTELEVYEAEISDAVTITDTGLLNLKVLSKNQLITYHGIATYTVDLSGLSKDDIELDEENKTVTLRIPHAKLKTPVNIPSDKIEFSDPTRGWLAFGKMNFTPEESAEVQTEAEKRMEEKLEELNSAEKADEFAIMNIWKIYQPLVSSVSPEYELQIEFQEEAN